MRSMWPSRGMTIVGYKPQFQFSFESCFLLGECEEEFVYEWSYKFIIRFRVVVREPIGCPDLFQCSKVLMPCVEVLVILERGVR